MIKVNTEHFSKAASYIDKHGAPNRRKLSDWTVSINDKVYPVKYTLSVACFLAGDSKDICNGNGFITDDARSVLKEHGLTLIEVKKL